MGEEGAAPALARVAVVLFNLGGPDRLEAVQPFLTNLFSDAAIISLPQPFRGFLARWIAARRTPHAQDIYRKLGGRSPLLPNTEAQARALEQVLGPAFRCFIAMRYWHPRARAVVKDVAAWEPSHLVLLPLYPQYSTTTTASSLMEFQAEARALLAGVPTSTVCCYPTEAGFIAAQAELLQPVLQAATAVGSPRVLFSAHGLPEKIIRKGDPYQAQCEQTARVLAALLPPGVDWLNTYQSRVGPLTWIGPATEDEIRRAGAEKRPVVVVPIAFVSEHSETLVELDQEYADLAHAAGVPFYGRVPTVSTHPSFIEGLAQQVRDAQAPLQVR